MRNKYLYLVFFLLLCACSTKKRMTTSVQENTRIETKYVISYRTDTMYIEIPSQTAEMVVRDSVNKLENDYATSEARINKDGSLYHNLKTKPQKKPTLIQIPTERKDSIIYKEKKIDNPIYIDKELSTFQKFQEKWFYISIAILLALLLFTFKNQIFKLR